MRQFFGLLGICVVVVGIVAMVYIMAQNRTAMETPPEIEVESPIIDVPSVEHRSTETNIIREREVVPVPVPSESTDSATETPANQ